MAFIELHKENFYHNLNQIALKTGSVEKIAIVLKDNAYGHGLVEMARLASQFGVTQAVVRNSIEAAAIKTYFSSILVLGDCAKAEHGCTFALNSLEDIRQAQKGASVELKVDTGMHRNGISVEQLEEALHLIQAQGLKLVGLMTHYRSADVLSSELFWQRKQFQAVVERVKAWGFEDIRIHSHNSATLLRLNQFREDIVRVGVAAYGYNELPSLYHTITLKPVLSLYAKRVSTRLLKKGQRVGYGGAFTAAKDMVLSTYDLGYGDGWCRGDTDNPYITAERLPIVGRVSMDLIALEGEHEVVCVMNDAQEAANQLGTISYEVMTALCEKIERVVV